jgi:hypothetical protein
MTITLQLMQITPEMATAILAKDAPNRPIKKHNVNRYAKDMSNGWWKQTGESLVFDQDRQLVQGQHRLHAVIQSGMTIEFVVVCGVESVSQDVMDTGARRSLGDQLARRGEKNCTSLASAIVLTKAWMEDGRPHTNTGVSNIDLLQWFSDHGDLRRSTDVAASLARRIKYPTGMAAAIHYQMSLLSEVDADEFWNVLCLGTVVENSQPMAKSDRGSVMKPIQRAGLTIRAWNAWVTGSQIGLLRWAPQRGEKFPVLINPNDL